jgi:membrane associated rhomboid family serine protease
MFRNLTPVVKNILIITVAIYVVTAFLMPQLKGMLALYYVNSNRFIPTQFLTYMFMHADGWHLIQQYVWVVYFRSSFGGISRTKKDSDTLDGMRGWFRIVVFGLHSLSDE